MKALEIAFLGNERHLLHALRAMTRYGVYSSNAMQKYTFLLFGDFPQEILRDQTFQYQYIGDDRIDMESFSDDYDLVLDPEKEFKAGGEYALSQWFEMKLNMEHSKKSSPFRLPSLHYHIRASKFRLQSSQHQVGNTIFIMPPSPQDLDWHKLPRCCPPWWASMVEYLDMSGYSIVYPQVKFESGSRLDNFFDYRFFFTGFEDVFCNRCYMPECTSINDLNYHLVNSRMYIGWSNLIEDLAAALHIPSIIIHNSSRRESREIYSVRNDEYLLHHVYFSNPLKWDLDKLKSSIGFIEGRLIPVALK